MALRIPLWTALALCAGCLALGTVWAQGKDEPGKGEPDKEPAVLTEYPYLPNRYGEPYIPSVADWQAIRLTALGASTTRLTQHFSRQHLTCFPTPKGLVLTLDLLPSRSGSTTRGRGGSRRPRSGSRRTYRKRSRPPSASSGPSSRKSRTRT